MRLGRLLTAGFLVLATVAIATQAHAVTNQFGVAYVGQERCLSCHGADTGRWQVGRYLETDMGQAVADISSDAGRLEPAAGAGWPSPLFGTNGLRFGPQDVRYQVGSPGTTHMYLAPWRNAGPSPLSTGYTLPKVFWGPADDWRAYGEEYDASSGQWIDGGGMVWPYFQVCGGCHFTGVTRPSAAEHRLANGGTMSPSTETSFSDMGVACEACHASSSGSEHRRGLGVSIARSQQALKSDVCGQCHAAGIAKERSWTGGTLSSPNGYTPDRKLSDFMDIAGSQYQKRSIVAPAPSIPATDPDFLPTGHYRGNYHATYNEWQLSAHSHSHRAADDRQYIPSFYGYGSYCLPCHTGEAFLKSIGVGKEGPTDIGLLESSAASDTLDVECGVCHTVHARTGEPSRLRLSEDELCGRCHGGTSGRREMVPGDHPFHQGEMRDGSGMIGVPFSAEGHMEDVSCADCHMPTVNTASPSHRFRVLTPGDAERFGVKAGGDSCTGCHKGSSRAQLQAKLDAWKAGTHTALDAAETALAAARSRAASTTPAGRLLISAAQTNVEYFVGSGADGAHNYEYCLAGLRKARLMARAVGARFTGVQATPYSGRLRVAGIRGRLQYGDRAPATGQRVIVEARPSGSKTWTRVWTATVESDGSFSAMVSPRRSTAYRLRWSAYNAKTTCTSNAVTVSVR